MKTSTQQHIDMVLSTKIRPLLEEAAQMIEDLKPGEKVPATKLAAIVAERHGLTGPQLYPTLKMMFDNFPERKISRGAHGGIENPLPEVK